MSTSLRAGINALSTNIDAAMICLPDMPLIGIYEINKLIDYYNPKIGNEICIATSNEQRGNPVLWDKKYFNELSDIKGDKGGRHLLSQYEEKSVEVNLGEAVSFDVDTKSSYNSLK
jgi:molybdenum cofactor cytidylyltransferase